ncbi:MAG TPA: membrane-bound lytic murein transglycosylase MltF, partial [Cellvibrionaceae bacterium]
QHNLEMIDLIEMVHRGEIDFTVVDSNAFDINRHVFPRARAAFTLGEPEPLAWAFPKRADTSLFERAEAYLQSIQESGALEQLVRTFFETPDPVSRGGALLFTHRLEHRLPQWHEPLQKAAEEVGLSWQLLAAVSYQESHWNPNARSPTGVRGLMMLTQITAAEMGVSNRLNPEQSINGGARYLRGLYDRLPERITEPERTWFALAAYNVGMGHLEDARILTQRHGGNPDSWDDVAEHLPLLAKRQYYRDTRYGYARGWEPVEYVRNIRQFLDIIVWHDQQEQRRLAMATSDDSATDEAAEENVNRNSNIMPMSVL